MNSRLLIGSPRRRGHRPLLIVRRNEYFSRWPNPGDLDDNFAIFGPRVMRGLGRLGIERTGGVGPELAFIPFVARGEVECARQDHNRSYFIRVPMRWVFPAHRKTDPRYAYPRLGWVPVQYRRLRRPCRRSLELNLLWEFENARAFALCVS